MTGWVSFTLMQMYANLGEVEDGMNTLTPPHGLTDAEGAEALRVNRGPGWRSRGVTFAYGRETGGIRGVDLVAEPGERVGVVGASGAGKSTLVSLLLRLYDAEGGRVAIDGQDVTRVTQASLRRSIALVTQETAMFNRSARDNILYGRPDATEAEMVEAARRAEAHEFILELEDFRGRRGYEAHLGERGVKLSGGQRQRVALARAILKDAPILVLDEATSALDSEVEAAIQAALDRGDGGQDGARHRAPALDADGDGPDRRTGGGVHRGGRHPRGAARARRPLRALLGAAVGRLHRRARGRGVRGWSEGVDGAGGAPARADPPRRPGRPLARHRSTRTA